VAALSIHLCPSGRHTRRTVGQRRGHSTSEGQRRAARGGMRGAGFARSPARRGRCAGAHAPAAAVLAAVMVCEVHSRSVLCVSSASCAARSAAGSFEARPCAAPATLSAVLHLGMCHTHHSTDTVRHQERKEGEGGVWVVGKHQRLQATAPPQPSKRVHTVPQPRRRVGVPHGVGSISVPGVASCVKSRLAHCRSSRTERDHVVGVLVVAIGVVLEVLRDAQHALDLEEGEAEADEVGPPGSTAPRPKSAWAACRTVSSAGRTSRRAVASSRGCLPVARTHTHAPSPAGTHAWGTHIFTVWKIRCISWMRCISSYDIPTWKVISGPCEVCPHYNCTKPHDDAGSPRLRRLFRDLFVQQWLSCRPVAEWWRSSQPTMTRRLT
jgi:hypothetical protein